MDGYVRTPWRQIGRIVMIWSNGYVHVDTGPNDLQQTWQPGSLERVARIRIRSVQYKPGWLCSDLRINLPASDATTYWPGK